MTTPETLGLKAFADHIGCKPSYITALKKAGRLVLTEDGKQVRVAESIARIEATRDPSMAGVAARHAQARGAELAAAQQPEAGQGMAADRVAETEKVGNTYQAARAVKERFLALAAKRDYEVSMGKLMPAEDVRHAIANAITVLRNDLENIPDSVAPVLASETDEARVRVLLADEIEHALSNLASRFAAIAKETAAEPA